MKNKILYSSRFYGVLNLDDFIWFNNMWMDNNKLIKHRK